MLDIVPQRNDALIAIEGAALADTTKARYSQVMARYLAQGGDPLNAGDLATYAQTLTPGVKAQLKAAVALYSNSLLDQLKAQANPSNVDFIQAAEYRTEALQNAVKVKVTKGTKAHTWLSQAQVKALLDTCNDGIKGQRDRLALGLLVAAGLRRAEAVGLTFADIELQPIEGRPRVCLNVKGKGDKTRVVPISDSLAQAIEAWSKVVGREGYILRSIDKGGNVNGSLSGVGLFGIVQDHGAAIGKPELAPHDLRRTYAQLGYEAGVPIVQISRLLGHASVSTTQRYLNLDLDFETTVSDFIPF